MVGGMGRAMLRAAAGCGLALSLAACGSGPGQVAVERAEWLVSGEAAGGTFTVSVYVGGSTCIDFDRVEVEEGDDVVEVAAYVRRAVGEPCSEDFGWRDVVVELDAPLGDRDLVGCAGEEVTVRGWNLDPGTDCAVPPQGWPPHEV